MIDALLTQMTTAGEALTYYGLGLDPIALDLGWFQLRWYSLAYLVGIVVGWWYLMKLIAQPGAPMARRHADDFVFYVTLGIILVLSVLLTVDKIVDLGRGPVAAQIAP